MSGGLPDAKPWASCCPISDATMTLTLMPVRFDHADVATLTAFVSAGPELAIIAVTSPAWGFAGDPYAIVAATAAVQTATDKNASRFQWNFKVIPSSFIKRTPGADSLRPGAAPLV